MHPNEELLHRFYDAFARLDADTMGACYGPLPHFSDPAFPDLSGPEVAGMWAMLLGRSSGIRIDVSGVSADDHKGQAAWVAHYAFGPAQRPVVNRVHSTFEFVGGLIARQQDTFNFHAWAAQALGWKGRLLGWTPLVQGAAQKQAAAGLKEFLAKQA